MADRAPVSIAIGGSITADDYAELAGMLAAESLSIEWGGEPFEPYHRTVREPLRLFAHEVAGGQFEVLEAWCAGKALPFVRWCGGYPASWGPERVVFLGIGEPLIFSADEEDCIVMARERAEALGSIEAIRSWFDTAEFAVPPLVVEGVDGTGQDAAVPSGSGASHDPAR